jgi:hypothetical protein
VRGDSEWLLHDVQFVLRTMHITHLLLRLWRWPWSTSASSQQLSPGGVARTGSSNILQQLLICVLATEAAKRAARCPFNNEPACT